MTDHVLNERFPYLEEGHGAESDGHVYLKNVAIHWLLQRGFTPDQIEIEHPIPREDGTTRAQTDVYAGNNAQKTYVECETSKPRTARDLSAGATVPARRGEPVYLVTDSEIYHVRYQVKTFQPGLSAVDGEEHQNTVCTFEPFTTPPLLPV